MQIHELTEMSGAPARSDVLAVDTGTVTDKLTILNLMKGILSAGDSNPITAYPTTGGLFRITSAITGKPADASNHGALAIFNCGTYVMHIWLDHNSKLFYGYTSGSTITTPSSWKRVFTPTDGALPVANGGTGATGTSSAITLTPTNADSRITSHNIYLYQWGKVCFLHVRLVCNFSGTNFTPGTNLDLTLPDAPVPVQPVTGVSYSGGNIIATRFHQTNLVRYRNAGGTLSGAETEMVTNFVYLTP